MKALLQKLGSPWRKALGHAGVLAFRATPDRFSWVELAPGKTWPREVLRLGDVARGQEDEAQWQQKLAGLALGGSQVIALLELDDYAVYKLPAPNVPPDELKAAARWQLKELVEGRLDQLTIDVLQAGDDTRSHKEMLVFAARNTAIERVCRAGTAGGRETRVVDVWETAQRNLQTAHAALDGHADKATAALQLLPGQCLLTISAGEELFYTRRLDADDRLFERATGSGKEAPREEVPLGFEYMPGDELSFGGMESEESSLIIELQRSIDVWERSWPDLPLSRLYVLSADHAEAVARLLQKELGLRTLALLPGQLFKGEALAQGAALPAACLPLLGAALRDDTASP
ncbi:MAG TPA: hypothetical protein VK195_06720 [Burkholderiaceae bacterium]|nr:hypothetical protein [Burkholderiaceae bacterium]